jgi:phage-related tail protein
MTEVPGTPAGTPAEGSALGAPAAPQEGTGEKMFPESYVKQLRDENATHRIAARDAATEVRAAVLGEVQPVIDAAKADASRLQDELGSAWIGAAKLEAALVAIVGEEKAKQVSAFAGAVQGAEPASIKASAESLRTLFNLTADGAPVGATDPTQGRGQRGLANPAQDPILKALTEASSRR